MKTLWLVFGWISTESEISVITTCAAYRYIAQCGYDIVPIYIDKSWVWYHMPSFNGQVADVVNVLKSGTWMSPLTIKPWINGLQLSVKKARYQSDQTMLIDILFPIMHGNGGEDGSIQWVAQMCGVPVVGPDLFTAQWTMDKHKSKILLHQWWYPVCDYMVMTQEMLATLQVWDIMKQFGENVIVKPCTGGSSIGVSKCSWAEQLMKWLELALQFDQYVMIEPFLWWYIEVCCAVSLIDGEVRASLIEDPSRSGEVLSFDDKYSPTGWSFTGTARVPKIPAELDPATTDRIGSTCESIYRHFAMTGTPRIDFLINPQTQELVILEINSIPGNLSMHIWWASWVTPVQLMKSLINQAQLKQYHYEQTSVFNTSILEQCAQVGTSGGKKIWAK